VDDALMVLMWCLAPVGSVTIIDGIATSALDAAAFDTQQIQQYFPDFLAMAEVERGAKVEA
jgi:hypothetical protein